MVLEREQWRLPRRETTFALKIIAPQMADVSCNAQHGNLTMLVR
jgi:hypothetical protein